MGQDDEPEPTGDSTPGPPGGQPPLPPPERDRRRDLLRIVGLSLIAVLAVQLIVMLLGVLGDPMDDEQMASPSPTSSTPAAGARDRGTGTAAPSDSAPPAAVPTMTDGTAAEDTASDDGALPGAPPSPPASPLVPVLPGAGGKSEFGAVYRPLPVYVLNQTTRSGLAAQVAEDIESAGWSVTKVSWWRGTVPSTTVYYPMGHEAAAQALSDAFPAIDRVRPRVAPMPDDALTVILCKEYPQG